MLRDAVVAFVDALSGVSETTVDETVSRPILYRPVAAIVFA
jgi:hypothetical protein